MNYYDILGVAKTASPEELKAAYRLLVKQHHPDLGGSPEMMKQINEAYDTLSDPQKRAAYDYEQTRPQFGQGFNNEYRSSPFTFDEEIFANFGSDFFHVFTGAQQNNRPKNRNIRVKIELDFLDTLKDQEKILNIKLSQGQETITVKIPAGIENGSNFIMRGKGDNEFPQWPRGNLEIVVEVKPHARFERQGANITTNLTIDCFEAILGTAMYLDTPSGKTINLKIPPGTQNGTTFGITDEGFPVNSRGVRGKFLIRVNVLVPNNLTKEQLNLVAEIQSIKPINT